MTELSQELRNCALLALNPNGAIPENLVKLISIPTIISLIESSDNPEVQSAIDTLNGQVTTINLTLQSLQNQIDSGTNTAQFNQLSAALTDFVNTTNTAIAALQNSVNTSSQNVTQQLNQFSATLTGYTTSIANNTQAISTIFPNTTANSAAIESLANRTQTIEINIEGLPVFESNTNNTLTSLYSLVYALQDMDVTLNSHINAIPKQIFPTSFHHFHDTSKIITGGALISVQQAASLYATNWQQNVAALNDSFSFSELLAAGTYTFIMLVTRSSNKGDLQLYIDGVLAFNDFVGYSATQVYERVTRTITITTDGLHNFVFTVYKKNVSSTGYAFLCSKFSAYKN